MDWLELEQKIKRLEDKECCSGYKYYLAILGQAGVDPPFPIAVLGNTLGITEKDYSYISTGWYKITKVGKFPLNKVVTYIWAAGSAEEIGLATVAAVHYHPSETVDDISISSTSIAAGDFADELLSSSGRIVYLLILVKQ